MQVIPDSLFSRLNSRAENREFGDCRTTLLAETGRIMIIERNEPNLVSERKLRSPQNSRAGLLQFLAVQLVNCRNLTNAQFSTHV